MPKSITHLLNLLGRLIIFPVLMVFFHPNQFEKSNQDCRSNYIYRGCLDEDDDKDRPSPLTVPVPFISTPVMSRLIKKKLPVVEFSNFVKQSGARLGENSSLCAICLDCIEENQEIRAPANCSHVYHTECVDGWIDHGQATCPLCRLKLLPAQSEEVKDGKDLWRMERIAYLFGEDYALDNS